VLQAGCSTDGLTDGPVISGTLSSIRAGAHLPARGPGGADPAKATFGALARQYFIYGGAKAHFFLKYRKLTAWRQWIPLLFLLGLVGSLLVGLWWTPALGLFALGAGTYLAVDVAVAVALAARHGRWDLLPHLAAAFPCIHFPWPVGFLIRLCGGRTGAANCTAGVTANPSGTGPHGVLNLVRCAMARRRAADFPYREAAATHPPRRWRLATNQRTWRGDLAPGLEAMHEERQRRWWISGPPHDAEGCTCVTLGLLAAAQEWGIDLQRSYLVGDTEKDMGAGRAAGVGTLLLRRRYNRGVAADLTLPSLRVLPALLRHLATR
jgi:hypothetical protein